MLWIRTEARGGLRWGVFSVISVAAFLAQSAIPAAAAPYSDIVVDANSGATLHQTNPDAIRHPASLTKIMTLYLLFEQLEAGKIKLDSQLKVSEFASEQSPTKLGLKPGSTIEVEDAIKGIVTRSANDASVVVAEAIAGSEEAFAAMMTRKARALGMSHTVYKNASGLPNDQQVTTARDQAILGRAIQERFPKYYKYFQTRSFTFRGRSIGNHNSLLGRVEGVDGIKTGYIRASGFNLVTSLHRDNRYVVAVVMGGSSAGSRDARMRELINKTIKTASIKRTAPMVAERKREVRAEGGRQDRIEDPRPRQRPRSPPRSSRRPKRRRRPKSPPRSSARPPPRSTARTSSASRSPARPRPASSLPAPRPRASHRGRASRSGRSRSRPSPSSPEPCNPRTRRRLRGLRHVPATAGRSPTPMPAKSDTPKAERLQRLSKSPRRTKPRRWKSPRSTRR